MEKALNDYLETVEKYLKPMAVSERIDIIKEIKSEMSELQANNVSSEQIIERLGDPKELAKAYLGESISKDSGFRWERLRTIIAFYSLAGMAGMFVLPVTSICAVAFMISGVLCPAAGIIRFVFHLLGYEIEQISFTIGTYTAGTIELLPISIVTGVILFVIGKLFWKLTLIIIKAMSSGKRRLEQ